MSRDGQAVVVEGHTAELTWLAEHLRAAHVAGDDAHVPEALRVVRRADQLVR